MRKKQKQYKAQALAIAMVVLVVSAIIGISIYSRTLKDRILTMGERASAEALEVSDLIIDYITKVQVENLIQSIGTGEAYNYDEGVTLKENSTEKEISALVSVLGLSENPFAGLNFCELSSGNGNEYYLNVKRADANTFFEIRAGQVISIPIKGDILSSGGNPCEARIRVAVRGDSTAGFSLLKTYAKYTDGRPTEFKSYELDDEQQYCFSSDNSGDLNAGTCNNPNFQGTGWLKFADNNSQTIWIEDLNETTPDGYTLDEVRIRAIGSTIGVSFTNTNCISDFEMMEINAAANCNGVFRGKQILLPEKEWGGPLFDYIIFNGAGSL